MERNKDTETKRWSSHDEQRESDPMVRDVSSATKLRGEQRIQEQKEHLYTDPPEDLEQWKDEDTDGEKDGKIYRMRRGVVGVKSCSLATREWRVMAGGSEKEQQLRARSNPYMSNSDPIRHWAS
ncbi:hypothetical protein PAMP_003098 [Pampus punctatissimus]